MSRVSNFNVVMEDLPNNRLYRKKTQSAVKYHINIILASQSAQNTSHLTIGIFYKKKL